jgi:Zn-dependent protease
VSVEDFLYYSLDELPFVFIALVIAFTVHEFAHAVTAYWFGDNTANAEGRVTLDPRAHLDWIGTIVVLLVGFGWAKPVPVNRNRFKRPRLMGATVSFAGPFSNLLLCVLAMFIFTLLQAFGALESGNQGVSMALITFFTIFVNLNLTLFLFNLIPLPPLDGWRIAEDVSPRAVYNWMQRYEHYGYLLLILLFVVPPLREWLLGPLYAAGGALLGLFYVWFGALGGWL